VGLHESPDEYLFEHCVSTALLSMSIGAQLGLSMDQIQVLGLSAMLHDIGMLKVPAEIRLAPRQLTDNEMAMVRAHPLHALRILEQVRGLPPEAVLIATQVHEGPDHRGYPHLPASVAHHPHAAIVAVADAFSAMMERRPYRNPLPPHTAVRELLNQGAEGRFDRRVLRAFLDAVSAFPVGSLVELKKGIVGRVIRSNPGEHTRPVIEVIGADGEPTEWTIDLAKDPNVKIVRALPALTLPAEVA